jgi:Flp pilus assembly pilin Flp
VTDAKGTNMNIQDWKTLLKDTRGETGFVEWIIIVGVIAIFCIVAFSNIGKAIDTAGNNKATQITGLP